MDNSSTSNGMKWLSGYDPRMVPWNYWHNLFSGLIPKKNRRFDAEGNHTWNSSEIFEEVHMNRANDLSEVKSIEWCQKHRWSAFEATAVSFGKDPTRLQGKSVLNGNFEILFFDRMYLIEMAQGSGQLPKEIAPADFVSFAQHEHLSYFDGLDEALSAVRKGLAELTAQSKALQAENRNLRAQIKELEAELVKWRHQDRQELGSKERRTAYGLILGMAMGAYEYVPRPNERSSAVKRILGHMADIGFELSEQRTRDWLKDAATFLKVSEHISAPHKRSTP
jgi:hypothetical protein